MTSTRSTATQVVELVGSDQYAGTVVGDTGDLGKEELLGPYVDTGGRGDQHQQAGVVGEGPRHDDLLLVAAGQAGDRQVGPGCLDRQIVDHRAGDPVSAGAADEPGRAEPARDGQSGVVGDRHAADQSLEVAVLRDESDSGGQRGGHVAGPQRPACDGDRAGAGTAQPDDRLGQLGLAAAARARQSDDLPGSDLESDIGVPAGVGQASHREDRCAGRLTGPAGPVDAQPGRASPVIAVTRSARVSSSTARGDDVPRVPVDRDGVADLVDLLQVVADEQESHALRLQPAHAVEQPADGGRVELGGRFVENDEPGAERQRPRDLHELPVLDAQLMGRPSRVDVDRPVGQQPRCLATQPRPADQPGRPAGAG